MCLFYRVHYKCHLKCDLQKVVRIMHDKHPEVVGRKGETGAL